MTTEPNTGSFEDIANMITEPPKPEENLSEVVEAVTEEPQDIETEETEEVTENEDVAISESDEAEEIELADEDELEEDTAVPIELSDDMELEYKSDGEIKRATLGELKRNAAGQDYIQKGMEQNAKVRKELEQSTQELQAERAKLTELVQVLENGDAPQKPVMPSKELQASDPLGYLEAMEEYRQDVEKYNSFMGDYEEQLKKRQQVQTEETQRYAQQQAELLREEMPELKDPQKSKEMMDEIQKVVVDHYGVPSEILGNLVHSWEFKIIHDAVRYQKLKNSKTKVVEKTKKARPMVKAGAKKSASANKVKQQQIVRSNMQKTGNVDDVAKYLLS
tara:strand:+ start:3449 stop:4453 length:1005 start_codon:yes stop_codon:yes gene_type:complete